MIKTDGLSRLLYLGLIIVLLASACTPVFTPEPFFRDTPFLEDQELPLNAKTPANKVPTSTVLPGSGQGEDLTTNMAEVKKTKTSTPTPTPVPIVGIEIERMTQAAGLNTLVDLGAHWTRRNAMFWSLVEPIPGERKWSEISSLEQEMIAASQAGLELIMVVRRTPTWAQKIPGNFCGPVAEEALDEFARFMADAVSRYSYPPYNVMYWEIGNEPDIDPKYIQGDKLYGCWGDEDDPYYGGGFYAEVLKAVYPPFKEANPQAQLLVGGLLMDCDPLNPPASASGEVRECRSGKFLEGVLINGGGDYFDGVSFHAYDYYWGKQGWYKNPSWNSSWDVNGPVLGLKADYLVSLLRQYQYFDKFLLSTETAVLCGITGKEGRCFTDEYVNTKSAYIAQSNSLAAARGIRTNLWYSLYGWRGSRLTSSSQEPTPAYQAFKFNAEMLLGSRYLQEVAGFPGIMGFEFERGVDRWWIVWALTDQETQSLQLPGLPQAVYDVFGAELAVSRKLEIGVLPVYILFKGQED